MIAIKQSGTNGGGYFGANSAGPFENPNYLTNLVEVISYSLDLYRINIWIGLLISKEKNSLIWLWA
jgi:K+-transporting ATPase ATPase A chain